MKWTHIEEGYPQNLASVIMLRKNGTMCIGYYGGQNEGYVSFPGDESHWRIVIEDAEKIEENTDKYDTLFFEINDVVWWCPLPEMPTEDDLPCRRKKCKI